MGPTDPEFTLTATAPSALASARPDEQNDGIGFNFYDAHDLNTARDSSQEASIKAQLEERMRNTKVFVLLVGERTRYLQKFVRWEIDQALRRDLPIIAVNLNGRRFMDEGRCPALLLAQLAIHVASMPR